MGTWASRVNLLEVWTDRGMYHMSHSLNSLKGDYIGDFTEDYYRGY